MLTFKVNYKTEKVMDEQKTVNSLLSMLQKRNNDILNLELTIAQLTDKLNEATKKEESDKDETEEQDI
tara:strand:- start:400 stop:603 length:204 start_codon:yes stop_codon:yes gene_type:complete